MLRVDPGQVGERDAVRRHPEFGAEMLRPIKLWEDLAPIVRHHHEWIDGSGYPDGLRGERIPLEARIIAVAEAFDALTSEQSYQQPIPLDEAVGRIEAGAGVQFDSAVVAAFVASRADLAAL
jgi:HD-GYP domain-containing protein (c-di-GMP phosphodiesterase class II)